MCECGVVDRLFVCYVSEYVEVGVGEGRVRE